MCLISFSFNPQTDIQLKLIANRDEYYARPSSVLSAWENTPIIAGRDLHAGGTWLGITATGRMAALTNYRDPKLIDLSRPSRGALVSDFLSDSITANEYIKAIAQTKAHYNPFNLLCFDGQTLIGFESRTGQVFEFKAGIYAVSNADFDSPWPKLVALKEKLGQVWATDVWPNQDKILKNQLFKLLNDTHISSDDCLPQTGISLERERTLSAAFINTPDYGTRACTVLAIGKKRSMIIERSFMHDQFLGESSYVSPSSA